MCIRFGTVGFILLSTFSLISSEVKDDIKDTYACEEQRNPIRLECSEANSRIKIDKVVYGRMRLDKCNEERKFFSKECTSLHAIQIVTRRCNQTQYRKSCGLLMDTMFDEPMWRGLKRCELSNDHRKKVHISYKCIKAWTVTTTPKSANVTVMEGRPVTLTAEFHLNDQVAVKEKNIEVEWLSHTQGNLLFEWPPKRRTGSQPNKSMKFHVSMGQYRVTTKMTIPKVKIWKPGQPHVYVCVFRYVPDQTQRGRRPQSAEEDARNAIKATFRVYVKPAPTTTPLPTTTTLPTTSTRKSTTTVSSTQSSTIVTSTTSEMSTSTKRANKATETIPPNNTYRCSEAKRAGVDLCSNFAKCFDTRNSYRCQCNPGYGGDGMRKGACKVVQEKIRITWECPPPNVGSGCVKAALVKMKQSFGGMNLNDQMNSVNKFTKQISSGEDLTLFSSVLQEMVQGFDQEHDKNYRSMVDNPGGVATMKNVSKTVLKTASDLLAKKEPWLDQNAATRRSLATNFTSIVEKTCMATTRVNSWSTINEGVIYAKVEEIPSGTATVDFKPDNTNDVNVKLFTKKDSSALSLAKSQNSPRVVFVRYKGIGEYLSQTSEEDKSDSKKEKNVTKLLVVSDIVSATSSESGLVKKIQFRLSVDTTTEPQNASQATKRCAYLNEATSTWAFDGCRMMKSERDYSMCECDHLTSFAILLDFSGATEEFSEAHKLSLTIITYVGCIISIFCCFFGVLTYDILRRSKGDRLNASGRTSYIIYEMICLSLLVAQTIFLMGIFHTQNKVICTIVAASLHYCFLLLFEWMLAAGVYYIIVFTDSYRLTNLTSYKYLIMFTFFLIPAIIVATSLGLRLDGYGTKSHCWLSVSDGLIWAFIGPVTVMLSINMILLSILIVLTWRFKANEMLETGQVNKGWVTSRAVKLRYELLFCIVLGATWIFGYLLIENVTSLVFSYIFTILNTLQGVFILISYANWNRIRDAYIAEFHRKKWLPESFRQWLRSRQYSRGGPPGVGMVGSSGTGSQRTRSARESGRGLLSGSGHANISSNSVIPIRSRQHAENGDARGVVSHTTRTTRLGSGSSGAKWSIPSPGVHGMLNNNENSMALVTETDTAYNENYVGHSMIDEPRQVFRDFDDRIVSEFPIPNGEILMTASMPLREHEEGGDHHPGHYSTSTTSSVASSASTTSPSSSYSDDNRRGAIVADDLPTEPPKLPVVCSVPSPFAVHHATALNGESPANQPGSSVTAPRIARRGIDIHDDDDEEDYLMPNTRAQRHTLDCRSRPRDDIDLRASVTAKQKRFSHSDLYANADDVVYYSQPPLEPSTLERGAAGFSRVTDV